MSAISGLTTNYQFSKINFDFPRWHTYANDNWDLLDAILSAFISNQQIRGLWDNSTIYAINDRVLDGDNGILYLCLVNHTSASSGLFAADRAANPTYWQPAITTPTFRGTWQTATVYSLQDFVVYSGQYAICEETHTSGVFATDVANNKWSVLIDASGFTEPAIPTTAEVDVASASTTDIGVAASGFIRITGTTTITSLGTEENKTRLVRFAGTLTLTHNLTSLILPTGANITTAAGDMALFRSDASGNWRCYFYQRASGAPLTVSFAELTGKPTTLSGYGITDAQGLDADLTAIAALSTQAYGRSLLEVANEAALKTLINAEAGVDFQAYDADTAKTDVTQQWTAPQRADKTALMHNTGANFSTKQNFTATVNGSAFTIANPSNAPNDGQLIKIFVTFSTTHGLSFGNKFKTTGYTPSATSGRKDVCVFEYDSAADLYYLIGFRTDVGT